MTAHAALTRLQTLANADIARGHQRFFKTGPGEYGEGDVFLGLKVPTVRQVVRDFHTLPLGEVRTLLCSPWHEVRLFALLVLVRQFQKGDESVKSAIYELYLAHTAHINNWDLVDTSAEAIVGGWLWQRERSILQQLAQSANLWERRIAILATLHFIRKGEFADTLAVARQLLHDPHDLIHKAVGWLLREVGKRARSVEEAFLNEHYRQMPRTMLRYAIEHFDMAHRLRYLQGKVSVLQPGADL